MRRQTELCFPTAVMVGRPIGSGLWQKDIILVPHTCYTAICKMPKEHPKNVVLCLRIDDANIDIVTTKFRHNTVQILSGTIACRAAG